MGFFQNSSACLQIVNVLVNILSKHFLYFIFLIDLFLLHWVFFTAQGLCLVVVSRGCSSLRWASVCCCRARTMGQAGFSSCSMWSLLGSGIEPVSPALADRFLTTGSTGKSLLSFLAFLPIMWKHLTTFV